MTIRWQALLAFTCASCGGSSADRAPAKAPIAAAPASTDTPPALFDGAADAIRARARVARAGAIRLEPALPALDSDEHAATISSEPRLVAATQGARVQILADRDDARLLIWIDRADLATVVVKAQVLVDSATGARGAVARPGAMIAPVGGGEVEIDDGEVIARGTLPASVLGAVYDQRPARTVKHGGYLAEGTTIAAAPSADARPIAIAHDDVDAHALAPARDGWIEIELDGEWLYVRGFVPVAAFAPGGVGRGYGSGTGYGMSDTATLLLPSGACLFARPGGPVVGVNTAERLRYVRDADAPGWRLVAIETDWGLIWPAVHFPERGGAPAGDFDRCPTTRPASAR